MTPDEMLQALYTRGSLENVGEGVQFSLKNRLMDASITEVHDITINGVSVDRRDLTIRLRHGGAIAGSAVSEALPIPFPLGTIIDVVAARAPLAEGDAQVHVDVETSEFGRLAFSVSDDIADETRLMRIPRSRADDYGEAIAAERRAFIESYGDVVLEHMGAPSFDPHVAEGNIENFVGVAQVPVGLAGPLTVHGEHAEGDFVVPLATTEGTLVASYNRGMKVLNRSGGVLATVVDDRMQRAPVFVFANARRARSFRDWVAEHITDVTKIAESTGTRHRLIDVDIYLAARMAYLRFDFTTGDAAGQNMVSKATHAASEWIVENYDGIEHFYLESNMATDKKASQINVLRTRGKRVIAEAVIPRRVLVEHMRVEPASLVRHHEVANVGSMLSGANNNGLHAANGIAAMFIATGQDVANVAESSAGIIHAELTDGGDLALSITLPSLIVATHGGGTNLPTQSEALRMIGCLGEGRVEKLAEIVAAVVLAGELSLAAAISASDWVASHERYGRNR